MRIQNVFDFFLLALMRRKNALLFIFVARKVLIARNETEATFFLRLFGLLGDALEQQIQGRQSLLPVQNGETRVLSIAYDGAEGVFAGTVGITAPLNLKKVKQILHESFDLPVRPPVGTLKGRYDVILVSRRRQFLNRELLGFEANPLLPFRSFIHD